MRSNLHALLGLPMLLVTMATAATSAQSLPVNRLPYIHSDGTEMVDADGKQVVLRGCNLGNWLLLEPWMFGGCVQARDQAEIFTTLASRFGAERRDHLIDMYRNGYITPRDFEVIRSFGFNVVRLPFHYSVVQDDAPPYAIKPNAFAHLDRALDMAEAVGVYVILDLHGAPGGQSKDMPTGEVGQNHLWTDPVAQQRTLALWRAIAQRYRDRSVVAAYDLLNEPYGDFKQNLRPDLVKLVSSLYTTIREVDDRHVMFAPGPIQKGINFYGRPREHGWHDLGFTEHYYPGLFGSKTAVESHATLLTKTFAERKEYLDRIGAPYYVGEFNVVFRSTGGNRMMREYFDRIAANGWTGTMWSYKLLNAGGHGGDRDVWYAATNTDPLPKLDLQTSSYEDFEKFFASLATMPLSINEPLRHALTMATPPPLPLGPARGAPTTSLTTNDWQTTGAWQRSASGGESFAGTGGGSIWQDVRNATPGRRYQVTIHISDAVPASQPAPASNRDPDHRPQLRLEDTIDGEPIVLNSSPLTGAKTITVSGTAVTDHIRISITSQSEGKLTLSGTSLADVTPSTESAP